MIEGQALLRDDGKGWANNRRLLSNCESSRDETEESDTIYKQQFLPVVRTPVAHRGLNECLSLTILNLGWSPFTKINWKRRVDCKEKKGCGRTILRSSSVGAAKLGLQQQLNLLYNSIDREPTLILSRLSSSSSGTNNLL